MALTDLDRQLIARCLDREPEAWCEFVDRYIGVVFHVVHHTATMRNVGLKSDEVEDLAADVLATIVDNNFKILRQFRGRSSLANYLTVIARRVVVNKLVRRAIHDKKAHAARAEYPTRGDTPAELKIEREEEVHRLLDSLEGPDAELIRAFYIDNKSYSEISRDTGIPENSIGPTLTRLREQLRKTASRPT